MTGYRFEIWADSTSGATLFVTVVTDPTGLVIGEVRALTEDTSLRLAHELKKADAPRFKVDHGIFG